MSKKMISISVPCFNEVENVIPLTESIIKMFADELPQYDYEILYIDNQSTDGTRGNLRKLCSQYPRVKAIFNERNFSWQSGYYGLLETSGDCAINIPADFQIPVDIIPKAVAEWEKGHRIVCILNSIIE